MAPSGRSRVVAPLLLLAAWALRAWCFIGDVGLPPPPFTHVVHNRKRSSRSWQHGPQEAATNGGGAGGVAWCSVGALNWEPQVYNDGSSASGGPLQSIEETVEEIMAYFEEHGGRADRVARTLRRTPRHELPQRWPRWRRNCDCLMALGFPGYDVTTALWKGADTFHQIDPHRDILPTWTFLTQELGLKPHIVQKVMRLAPEVMLPRVQDRVAVLYEVGFTKTMLTRTVARWPLLLCCPPSVIFLVSGYLSSQAIGFKARDLGNLYQYAPWLLHISTPERLEPILTLLRSQGVRQLNRVIRGYPQMIMLDTTDLQARLDLLRTLVPGEGVARMVEAVPLLLGLNTETQLLPMVKYLEEVLTIPRPDLTKMLRAFPALLSLDIKTDVEPVLDFLSREVGIKDVARFIARLPPVLGYRIDTDLRPKYHFLRDRLGMGPRELSRFPGYFAHPLQKRIIPRVEFVLLKGLPPSVTPRMGKFSMSPGAAFNVSTLKRALTFGDRDFAEDLLETSVDEWKEFLNAYYAKMAKDGEESSRQESSGSSRPREDSSGGDTDTPSQEVR